MYLAALEFFSINRTITDLMLTFLPVERKNINHDFDFLNILNDMAIFRFEMDYKNITRNF